MKRSIFCWLIISVFLARAEAQNGNVNKQQLRDVLKMNTTEYFPFSDSLKSFMVKQQEISDDKTRTKNQKNELLQIVWEGRRKFIQSTLSNSQKKDLDQYTGSLAANSPQKKLFKEQQDRMRKKGLKVKEN